MDVYRDQALVCDFGSTRGWRHDSQEDLFAGDLFYATSRPILEPPQKIDRIRPYIKALGVQGGLDSSDFTSINTIMPVRILTLARCLERQVKQTKNGK